MKMFVCVLFSWYFSLHMRKVNSHHFICPEKYLLQGQEQNLFGDNSPNISTSLPTLGIVCLFDSSHASRREVVSRGGFDCIFLITSNAKHFFMCLLALSLIHI